MTADYHRLVTQELRSRYYPRKLSVFDVGSGLSRNVPLKAEFSDLVEQNDYSQPIRNSHPLRTLAHQAILTLENRSDEDIKNWAERLATDVADVAD